VLIDGTDPAPLAGVQLLLVGSYISALAVTVKALPAVFPPVTSTRLSVNSVAVWKPRAVLIDGTDPAPLAGVQLLLVGS
jgi:hypothetical protein